MAERRMFHRLVVESDRFLDLPVGAQALYFHLGMQADDDGFVGGPRLIARQLRRPYKELQALIDAGFLLEFDGIVILTHWRMANSLQNDRLHLPRHTEIAKVLFLNEQKLYTKCRAKGCKSLYSYKKNLIRKFGIPVDSQKKGKELKGKEEKGKEKNRMEKSRAEAGAQEAGLAAHSAHRDSAMEIMNGKLGKGVLLMSQDQHADLLNKMGLDAYDYYLERLSNYIVENNAKVKNHYETVLKWWNEDRSVKV